MSLSTFATAFMDVSFFRLLPFLAYVLVAGRAGSRQKLMAAGLVAVLATACVLCSVGMERLACAAAATGYVAVSAFAVHRLALAHARGSITRPALGVLFVFAYLVGPGLALPPQVNAYFLALGWEVALAAYSYVLESPRRPERSNVFECGFFLVANPLLVYTPRERLRVEPTEHARGLRRALLGLAVMGIAIPLSSPRELAFAAPLGELQGYAAFIANGVLVFVARYAALSGLASLQIGALRVLGYALPERYVYPFLARSPLEFWRRWNLYVGEWFKHYVFVPLGLALMRSRLRVVRAAAGALALAATMLLVGGFHDLFVYSAELRVRSSGSIAFGIAAASMVGWSVLARLGQRLQARMRSGLGSSLRMLGRPLQHLALAHVLCAVVWFFAQA